MMVLGPVFHFELIRIARRWWLYAIRFAFGLILLLLLSFNFLTFVDPQKPWTVLTSPPPVTIAELARFGQSLFYSIMAAQGTLVCFLTPGLVADAIAGERQRKTLHYLMNTRIWAGEIVLGKLASRMLHLTVFVVVTLPILSLLTLMGGIDPVLLVWSYGATFSTGFLLAALGIFASTTIRRPRDAMLASYAYAILVLFGPAALRGLLTLPPAGPWTPLIDVVVSFNSWLELLSPLCLLTQSSLLMILGLTSGSIVDSLAAMIGAQAVAGTLVIGVAALLVRPAYRWIESRGAGGESRRGTRRRRIFPRPAIGSYPPMLWKELFVSGASRGPLRVLTRLGLILIVLGILTLVLWPAPKTFAEVLANGYWYHETDGYAAYAGRNEFSWGLRIGGAALMGVWLVTLAGASAGSIALEREEDTWTGLLSTPLDGDEILRGKMLGSLAGLWPLGATIVLLWMVGLVCGALHPVGFVLGILAFGLFTWYAIALGTYCSLHARTAWRAQGLVLAVLIAPHFCCAVPSPLYLTGFSLLSWSDVAGVLSMPMPTIRNDYEILPFLMMVGYFVGGPLLYLGVAFGLTQGAFRTFDVVVDRPRPRPRSPRLRHELVFLKPDTAKPDSGSALADADRDMLQE